MIQTLPRLARCLAFLSLALLLVALPMGCTTLKRGSDAQVDDPRESQGVIIVVRPKPLPVPPPADLAVEYLPLEAPPNGISSTQVRFSIQASTASSTRRMWRMQLQGLEALDGGEETWGDLDVFPEIRCGQLQIHWGDTRVIGGRSQVRISGPTGQKWLSLDRGEGRSRKLGHLHEYETLGDVEVHRFKFWQGRDRILLRVLVEPLGD